MSHLTIRIPDDEKHALDELARILKTTTSDLLRRFILPMTKLASAIEAIETIDMLEKKVVEMIVKQREFQQIMKKLDDYMVCENIGKGWERREYEEHCYIAYDGRNERYATIIVDDGVWWPAFIVDNGFDSSYGTHHYYAWDIVKIDNFNDLAEWLELVASVVDGELRARLDSLRRLLCLS